MHIDCCKYTCMSPLKCIEILLFFNVLTAAGPMVSQCGRYAHLVSAVQCYVTVRTQHYSKCTISLYVCCVL